MTTGTADDTDTRRNSAQRLPEFPGENFLAHQGSQWLESAEAIMAAAQLIAVAKGFPPQSTACIVDVDLDDLPALPASHRDYERRLEARTKVQAQNKANHEKRWTLEMNARTIIYTMCKQCTEKTAPILSRELKELCDLSHQLHGGFFDGPRAWSTLVHKIKGGSRTETDKDFYRGAERLQRASPLADGATAEEYSKRALAWFVHIRPNLAQSYDDDDTAAYLISLMPKALREGGRRIKREMIADGTIHDFTHVIQTCRQLVLEEQKAAAPSPPFVMVHHADLENHDLESMQRTTGMYLSLDGCCAGGHPFGGSSGSAASLGGAFVASPGKWCADCPHGEGRYCFQDPAWPGPPPLNVFLNKERWKGILAARTANSNKSGIAVVDIKLPSLKDIDAFKKSKKERRERAATKAKGTSVPGGLANAESDSFNEWREQLVDIMMVAVEEPDDDLPAADLEDGDDARVAWRGSRGRSPHSRGDQPGRPVH
jgi:hypothetical protein